MSQAASIISDPTPRFFKWRDTLQQRGGAYLISEARGFAHDETDYDTQYHNDPTNLLPGQGLVRLCREYSGDFSGPAVEIGCGTGLLSLGLVKEHAFPYILLTDPSPAFLNIARRKLTQAKAPLDQVGFGVLMAEELGKLPPDTFSLIVLRSVLHHVIDIPAFFAQAAGALRRGGMLVMEEPCQEGAVVMATMAQFIPLVVKQSKRQWTDECQRQLQLFLDTMKFYARTDIDKSQGEDKHLFRVDELMAIGSDVGISVKFAANRTFYDWAPDRHGNPKHESFTTFFHNYLKYCMRFDEPFMDLFDEYFAPYCGWVEELAQIGNGPYFHGVFVCRKQ
jgi:ubiquinone/menaquinone biosynthesis C-methylase UbiE